MNACIFFCFLRSLCSMGSIQDGTGNLRLGQQETLKNAYQSGRRVIELGVPRRF